MNIQFRIGNGTKVFLWFDNWYGNGPLIEKYKDKLIYGSGLVRYAKISTIIDRNKWKWPCTNHLPLIRIKEGMKRLPFCGEDRTI